MPVAIGPPTLDDIPELSRFLREGFRAPADAEFAAPDVLRWKYLDPRPGIDGPRSLVARDEDGRIVGHVGLDRTTWQSPGAPESEAVPTFHMLDWLAAPGHRGVGASLMRRANATAPTQYGFGGSEAGRKVIARAGYDPLPSVPVFRRVLRPLHRLREPGPLPGRLARILRDLARPDRPARGLGRDRDNLRPVPNFAAEPAIPDLIGRCEPPLLCTDRGRGRLDALLRYPRGGPVGFVRESGGDASGFGVVNLFRAGTVRIGKIVELFLSGREPAKWAVGFVSLASELARRGADVALACGANPWEVEGLRLAGFREVYRLDLQLRDPSHLLPREADLHVTFLEVDYGFTP